VSMPRSSIHNDKSLVLWNNQKIGIFRHAGEGRNRRPTTGDSRTWRGRRAAPARRKGRISN